ncbi:MAG: hypothetical protein KID00_05045 [Clostridium argentinense]|uniref:hypothetical protein n=1 Tax=Clostridium butanoliproducens TaxID=2991837 RepID=UPI001DEE399B|nr:hypothetical protein [Clostridium butanoliproducens]MBS5823217.1 hypothetical protein [Clostridium argentinense]MDU1349011.1 hypothetical protein [Clostridium argentinense]
MKRFRLIKLNILIIVTVASIMANLYLYNFYSNISKEVIGEYELKEDKKNYGFVDALETILSYESLDIVEMSMDGELCNYKVNFNGSYKELMPIVNYLKGFQSVESINNIIIIPNEKITFDITFIKNK